MKKYNVIYADCPWSYDNEKSSRILNKTGKNMAAFSKYNTLSLQDLCEMPIKNITEGQVIVCENSSAEWLPFVPLKETIGVRRKTQEVIWTNYHTHFNNVQQKLELI